MMNDVLILDGETSTFNKGSPFDRRNYLLCIGYRFNDETGVVWFEYREGSPLGESIARLRDLLLRASRVVFFNAKFDLHWLHRYGIEVHSPVWDCQVYEFVASGQNPAYPSLEGTCAKYNLGEKFTEIEELWQKTIDARLIPQETLERRVTSDVDLTAKLYAFQQEDNRKRSRNFQTLIQLEMLDLRALEEIEWNGQKYDKKKALELAQQAQSEIDRITSELGTLVPDAPINWNSTLHKSAALYGGIIEYSTRVVVGKYKNGARAGSDRFRIENHRVELPRLIEPLRGSDLDRDGYYSTASDVLLSLKARGRAKLIISLLLQRQALEKQVGTYFEGIPAIMDEMGWDDGIVHGQFNQVVAVTGRLSSSGPNLQNQPPKNKELFVTRFE